ncbi:uncharacterized protein LOC116261688 [Nymphaea colorata]|nr:uncharacterized protein LOC116261688 [Nymphaea colorata]
MEEGIEGVAAGEAVADPIARSTKAADDLYAFRDTYFPSDPVEKISALHQQANIALRILDDAFPLDQRKEPSQRASFEFLRGKILDVYPEYRKEAEDHLSKAVKLNPSLLDAWLCLGNCMWKKGDLSSARNCFSLALQKGPDKKILSQLSMLERRLAQGAENQCEMVDESIRHAKEAVMLDVRDGYSWYILGNAFLTSFFVAGAWEQRKLLQSIKAYQNAEKDEKANTNPDLYFNCAIANRYLENYERALSGFDAAASKDPSLNAKEEAGKIVDLLNKLEDSILEKGSSRPRRISVAQSNAAVAKRYPSCRISTINLLLEGQNETTVLEVVVLLFIRHDITTPVYFLVLDSDDTHAILSVYGLHSNAIKEGDRLTLINPFYRVVDFTWKAKAYYFKSLRVDFLEQIHINGMLADQRYAIRNSIHAHHVP